MVDKEKSKAELYRWIKISGLLSFIPFILVSGPFAAYFLGDFLEKRFRSPHYISVILIVIGFAASIKETIRVIRIALRSEKKV